ncbi:MAG: DNA repair protein RecO [Acidobacteria bacterium]|nr:DNA repair protein RecO [Acidobacteriota bacterium]
MPIYEDEAIVLRQYPIAESDSIVVCVAPELGKIRAVAQGIKKAKSRFAGCLEPLNHIKIAFFNREGRELGKIRHVELIHSYSGKIPTLEHIFAFTFFAELTHALAQENQSNPALFRLLLASLKAGENKVPILPLVRYFEVWCLKISGFYPNYACCSNCGKSVKDEGFFARIEDGTACCIHCGPSIGIFVGAAAAAALQKIIKYSPENFAAVPLESEAGRQLERLTHELLDRNLDSPLKSYRILKEAIKKQIED